MADSDPFWGNYFAQGADAVRPPVTFDTANADASRAWQTQMIQSLQRAAAGDPKSRAQQSLLQGYADARAGQSALGSATRGTGGAAGLRQGIMGGGNVQRGYAGDSAMLMNQEQTAAQALLAQQLAAQRQADMAQAQGAANNVLGNQGLDNAMRQFYEGQGLQYGLEQTQLGADRGRARLGFDLEAADTANRMLNRGVQAGATALATASKGWGKPKSSQQAIDDAFNGD